jgi:hypothetical protein
MNHTFKIEYLNETVLHVTTIFNHFALQFGYNKFEQL